jgi:hypothetical protein
MVSELAEAVAKVEEHRGAPRVEIRAGMAPKTGMGMNFFSRWGILSKKFQNKDKHYQTSGCLGKIAL